MPATIDVDVVAAAQAVIGHREQAVGVRRQVDADDLGLLVHDVIDEPRILVREPVVVLAPHVRGEQVVQRRDRPPPGDVASDLQPFGVLVEHGVDDVDERLVAVEQPVAAGQQVALEPSLAEVLGQDLHDPAVGSEVIVAVDDHRIPGSVGDLEHGGQPVRRRLVGPHDAGSVSGFALITSRSSPPSTRVASLVVAGRGGHLHGVITEVGHLEVAQQQPAVGVGIGAHTARATRRERGQVAAQAPRWRRTAPRRGRTAATSRAREVSRVVAHSRQRHLMGAEGPLGRETVDLLGSGPALGRAQHDHRPGGPLGPDGAAASAPTAG